MNTRFSAVAPADATMAFPPFFRCAEEVLDFWCRVPISDASSHRFLSESAALRRMRYLRLANDFDRQHPEPARRSAQRAWKIDRDKHLDTCLIGVPPIPQPFEVKAVMRLAGIYRDSNTLDPDEAALARTTPVGMPGLDRTMTAEDAWSHYGLDALVLLLSEVAA